MQMVELILQGVRGFTAQTRLGLAPGHVVLQVEEPQILWPALEALLFVDGRSVGELHLDPGSAEVCRAAITLRATDGTLWRVVRDLRGATALQRLDPAKERFQKVASNPGEIGPYLRTQVGLPNRSIFEELFTLAAADFPSARAASQAQAGAEQGAFGLGGLQGAGAFGGGRVHGQAGLAAPLGASGQGWPQSQGAMGGFGAGGLQGGGIQGGLQPAAHLGVVSALAMEAPAPTPQRPSQELIPELERELEAAREVEEIQRRLDEVQARFFELEEALKLIPKAREASEAASRRLERFVTDPSFGGDLYEEREAYRQAEAKREAALSRIEGDREALEEGSAGAMPTPVLEDRWFWASAVAGLLCLGAGFFSQWKALALLAIPLFGVAAGLAYRHVAALQGKDRYGRRRALLAEREKKVAQDYEASTQAVRQVMEVAGVESVSELEAWLEARTQARGEADAAARELAALEADPELQRLEGEREGLAAEVEALEEELRSKAAAAFRTAGEIERELELLRGGGGAEVASAEAVAEEVGIFGAGMDGGGANPFGALGPPGQQSVEAEVPLTDDSARLIDRVAELFLLQRDALLASIGPRASQYLEALTGRRYGAMSWGGSGGIRCTSEGGEIGFGELAPRHQDLAWLSLRLAAVEAYVSRYPLPLVLDEPFLTMNEQRQALLARMLKGIAAKTQILHRTQLEVMTQGATVVAAG